MRGKIRAQGEHQMFLEQSKGRLFVNNLNKDGRENKSLPSYCQIFSRCLISNLFVFSFVLTVRMRLFVTKLIDKSAICYKQN